ncbi:MAG: HEAT repeat domain-containing protein [Ignavibacteriaceae bacterium]
MLTSKYPMTNLVTTVLLAAILLFTGSELLAKGGDNKSSSKEKTEIIIPEITIKNLAAGIQSDNEGLKRSSIYMAGFYNIEELSETLVNEMKTEKNADTRVLIAIVLFKIGSPEQLNDLEYLMLNDYSDEVKTVAKVMFNLFDDEPILNFSVRK